MADDPRLDPVRKQIDVPIGLEAAFDLFTRDMDSWWPFDSHSIFEEKMESFRFGLEVGADIVETGPGGEECVWGTITHFDRPTRLEFTWHPGRDAAGAQTVSVTFSKKGTGTSVVLEHSGWESLGERAADVRANYETGWDLVFTARFGAAARDRADPG